MTKTLTKHLQAIKDSKRGIFVPYIMAGDHAKGLDGLFETIALFDSYHQEASRTKNTGTFGYHDLHQPSLSIWYRSLC